MAAAAAPCAGFTDVQDTAIFCTATQWLKNRGITTGCGDGTTYCPDATVTRASMSLFLNRAGIALTPKLVGRSSSTGATVMQPNQFNSFCFGAPLPAVNYPQTARARGTIAIPMSGPVVVMYMVMTLNGAPYLNMNVAANRLVSPSGVVRLSWSSDTMAVPGATVGFAIGLENPAGSGSALTLSAGTCALDADVVNANPTSAPFDQAE